MAKVGNFNEVCKFISKIEQNGMLSGLIRLLGNGSTEIQRRSRCPHEHSGAAGLEALRARDARMTYSDIVAAHIDTEGDSARWRRLCLMAMRGTVLEGLLGGY